MKKVICLALSLFLLLPAARASEPPVTREAFVTLLWEEQNSPAPDAPSPFQDTASEAVSWACEKGLTHGTSSETFTPNRPITREEAAVLLRRYDAMRGIDVTFPSGPSECNENEGISPWADDSLYWACETGRIPWRDSQHAPQVPLDDTDLAAIFPSPDPRPLASPPGKLSGLRPD